jgi:hypothetical protein
MLKNDREVCFGGSNCEMKSIKGNDITIYGITVLIPQRPCGFRNLIHLK